MSFSRFAYMDNKRNYCQHLIRYVPKGRLCTALNFLFDNLTEFVDIVICNYMFNIYFYLICIIIILYYIVLYHIILYYYIMRYIFKHFSCI